MQDFTAFIAKKESKTFSNDKKDLGMACHTSLKEAKKQGEMPLHSLRSQSHPIYNVEFRDGWN